MDTENKGKLWCTTCEKESAEYTCPNCGKPMLIIPSKETCERMGSGMWKRLDKEYTENKKYEFNLDTFRKEIQEFYKQKADEEPRRFLNEFELQCLEKTDEELEEFVPDGSYEIGTGSLIAWTGKGGFIMYIKALRKNLKNE